MGQKQGLVVETGEGNVKAMVWGWGAVILGIGITVSAILLSASIGLALTILSSCTGFALICVGAGEGVKRILEGHAAEIEARAQLEEAQRRALLQQMLPRLEQPYHDD